MATRARPEVLPMIVESAMGEVSLLPWESSEWMGVQE